MNKILLIGIHGHGPPGLYLLFLLIWISIYSYSGWKRRKILAKEDGTEISDDKNRKQRRFLVMVVLIGLILPVWTLLEQVRIGINTGGDNLTNAFEVYSGQVVRNLILFLLIPFLISTVVSFEKGFLTKEFPVRVFNNLVIVMVVLVSLMSVLISFQHG